MNKTPRPKKRRRLRLTYSVSQAYLELARSAVESLDAKRLRAWRRSRGVNRVASLLLCAASLTIIYSYLAIESFVNYHLYQVWMRPDGFARRQIQQRFPQVQVFTDLRRTKVRDLRGRLKLLCSLFLCRALHEVNPALWADFVRLLEASRHFLTHPIPDQAEFQTNMTRTMKDTEAGRYVHVAQEIIRHFYAETHASPPRWLNRNMVIKLKGFGLVSSSRAHQACI